jgi:hypothetical protein
MLNIAAQTAVQSGAVTSLQLVTEHNLLSVEHFEYLFLSPSSGESQLSWTQSIELVVPISGHQHQHKIGYILMSTAVAMQRPKGGLKHQGRFWAKAR